MSAASSPGRSPEAPSPELGNSPNAVIPPVGLALSSVPGRISSASASFAYGLSPPVTISTARMVEPLAPATHSNMLSSRRWPADEPRPLGTPTSSVAATPTKSSQETSITGATSSLTSAIKSASEIIGLDMAGFRIKTLPPNLYRFTFLTELRLAGNYLTFLPSGISSLRALAFLDLSNNQLNELPPEMGFLTNLRELLLFNNHLEDLPGEMGYLYQLENLGLDGNPLNETLLPLLHSQGSLSIIPFLRDHMITIAPPGDRTWQTLDSSSYIVNNNKGTFTLLCYNILCDKYATSQMFGYVPSWFLNWEYRRQVIIHEILSYDADLVCLQEMESLQFEQYFRPQLRLRGGYDGIFHPKSRAKTMHEVYERPYVDGCAIFWKVDRFELKDQQLVEFNQVALSRPSLRKHKDMYNRVMTRDNIAVLARLVYRGDNSKGSTTSSSSSSSSSPSASNQQQLILANVHIHWDPSFRDVKLVQTIMLLEELEKFCSSSSSLHSKAGIIICGDFNSLPGSGVCSLLETGWVPPDHEDFMQYTYEPYTTEGAKHIMNLRNAYASAPEPLNFTSYTPMFLGVIDYIWYKPGPLNAIGCLGSVPTDYVKQVVGLPTQHLPSDHISLLVEFKLESSSSSNLSGSGSSHSSLPSFRGTSHNTGGSAALRYTTTTTATDLPSSGGGSSSRRQHSRNKHAQS